MDRDLQTLHDKLDYLTAQFEVQRQRQQVMDDLLQDMTPAINGMFQMAVDELDEVGTAVELSDVMALFKRLLRDVRLLNGMLDKLESVVELGDDLNRLAQPTFIQLVQHLDEFERRGYFSLANEGLYIVDRIVTEFSEEDAHALGDNIVTILKTVRSMTQPEVMTMVNHAMDQLDEPLEENVSLRHLLSELRNPEVRKGLARLLHMVKGLAT